MHALHLLLTAILVKTFTQAAPVSEDSARTLSNDIQDRSDLNESVAISHVPRRRNSTSASDKGKRPLVPEKGVRKTARQGAGKAKVITITKNKNVPRDDASGYWRTFPHPAATFSPHVVMRGDPADEGTSESRYKSLRVIEEERRAERKAAFWAQYHEQKLGHHLPEKDLAQKVRAIDTGEQNSQWKSAWVKARLKQTGASDQYIANFRQRTKELTYKLKNARKTVGKSMPEKDLLERLKKLEERKNREGHVRKWSAPQLVQKERQEALTARAGELFEEHMKAKNLDVDKLSAEDIEYHTRNMKTEGAKNRFAMSLNRYLTKERPSIDLDIFKSHRDDHLRTLATQKEALEGHKRKRGRKV